MSKRKERRPPPMVEKTVQGLRPLTPLDAEAIDRHKIGQAFDLVPRTRRSPPQLRLYWAVLDRVVDATGAWPGSAYLHDVLMKDLGFTLNVLTLSGEYEMVRDSLALDAMNNEEANIYVTSAFARLAEVLGVDPLDLLPERPPQ